MMNVNSKNMRDPFISLMMVFIVMVVTIVMVVIMPWVLILHTRIHPQSRVNVNLTYNPTNLHCFQCFHLQTIRAHRRAKHGPSTTTTTHRPSWWWHGAAIVAASRRGTWVGGGVGPSRSRGRIGGTRRVVVGVWRGGGGGGRGRWAWWAYIGSSGVEWSGVEWIW
jgi:hypothetical protein